MTDPARRLVLVVLTGCLMATAATPALADGPGVGTPTIVSLGDSYISGEAGRWAGNTNQSSSRTDGLGPTAYYDNASGSGEQIARCHRSKSAEVFVGGGVAGRNLACSGARTATFTDSSGYFKPGIDFYSDSSGRVGQARALQTTAAGANVKAVLLSIGGNNFNFASIVQSCVTDWLTSPSWLPNYCNDDSSVRANFTAANLATQTAAVRGAIQNVAAAMANAGYAASQWTLVVQTYPSPLPRGSGFRYSQSGYTRQNTGGCGFWNRDADWANDTALPTINGAVRDAVAQSGLANVRVLDLQSALNGRRLCESGVGLLEERGLSTWQSPGAVDQSEWVEQIRTVSTVLGPTTSRSRCTPTTGGSSPSATACAAPTTAALSRVARAPGPAPGSPRRASP